MKRIIIPVMVLALAGPALAQTTSATQEQLQAPRISVYLYADYLKGQSESFYSSGSVEGLGAGLFLIGGLSDKITYTLEARFKSVSRIEIEQAWLAFNASGSVHLTLGAFLVPFGKYNQSNRPHETRLIHKPLVLDYAYPDSWRELGVQGSGKLSFLNVTAYIGNGLAEGQSLADGQQFRDNNVNKAWGARLGIQPSQGIDLGFSYYQGKYDTLDQRNLKMLGGDATWATKDYQILAEYIKTENVNPASFAKGVVEGYFIQLAFIYSGFYPVVSFQKVRQEDPFHGSGWVSPDTPGAGLFANKSRWAIGVAYVPAAGMQLKVEYDFNQQTGPALKDNLLTIQAAVSF